MARVEHDVVLTLPASAAFAPVARQAALELARRRGFGPRANDDLAGAVSEAFALLAPADDQLRLTFGIVPDAIVVTAVLLSRPGPQFQRAVPGP